MTHDVGSSNVTSNDLGSGFTPTIPLSDYAKKQYLAMQRADTGMRHLHIIISLLFVILTLIMKYILIFFYSSDY